MRKIKLLIVLFPPVPVWKPYQKINFPIVLSRFSVLKLMTEVSVSCILCCKFKNITSMNDVNKMARCLFLVPVCLYACFNLDYLRIMNDVSVIFLRSNSTVVFLRRWQFFVWTNGPLFQNSKVPFSFIFTLFCSSMSCCKFCCVCMKRCCWNKWEHVWTTLNFHLLSECLGQCSDYSGRW